ncbi:MAG: ankyrin repeat domain-containing protein [Rickettsiaceae bacterium]|nr:ankyrin repeat domain-containing protein [Rickettsiaceae bacterium]
MNLIESIKNKDIKKVQEILKDKAINVNEVDKYEFSALHYAVREGLLDVVDPLIEQGAEVNLKNKSGATPLIQAVMHNRIDIAAKLLGHQADPNISDNYGYNSAHTAACNANFKMLKLLLK